MEVFYLSSWGAIFEDLEYKTQLEIRVALGDNKARYTLVRIYLNEYWYSYDNNQCKGNHFLLDKSLDLLTLQSLKRADRNNKRLFLSLPWYFDRWNGNGCVEKINKELPKIFSYKVAELFKDDDITQIESWIEDNDLAYSVIRFYYKNGYLITASRLLSKLSAELETTWRVDKLLELANMIKDASNYPYDFYLRNPPPEEYRLDSEAEAIKIYQIVLEKGNEAQKKMAKFKIAEINKDIATLKDLAEEGYLPAAWHFSEHRGQYSWSLVERYLLKAAKDSTSYYVEGYGNIDRKAVYLGLYWLGIDSSFSHYRNKDTLIRAGCDSFNFSYSQRYKASWCDDIAYFYWEDKEYNKAEEIYKSIVGYSRERTSAFTCLGDIYYKGLGRRQDLKQALEYYGKACDLNNQDGCKLYAEVNEKIH